MKEELFIKNNTITWKELENYFNQINKKGLKSLKSHEVKRFLYVFRQSSHHLAYCRTHYPNSNTIKYLNSLIGKCHSYVYGVRKTSPKAVLNYIVYQFPLNAKAFKYYILSAFTFFTLGFLISLILVFFNPDLASLFLPESMIEGVKSGHSGGGQWNYPLISSQIMTNNIGVSLKCFVLGITLGIGTVYILFYNGAILGSLTALVYLYGSPLNYWSLILPHGIFELTAIFIAGASGLIIAKNILIPGELSRKHSLIDGSKKALSLIGGVVVMLVIAGIIEGFFTPQNISETAKLCFAAITALILIVYFSIPYLPKNFKRLTKTSNVLD